MIQTIQPINTKSTRPYKFAVVIAEFNREINENLLAGVAGFCRDAGLSFDLNRDVFWVPGSYEIPLVSGILAQKHTYDAIVTIGTVIKGETDHYDAIVAGVSQGIWRTSLEFQTPITFGILTVRERGHALARSRVDNDAPFKFHANAGYGWAKSAYQTLETITRIREEK